MTGPAEDFADKYGDADEDLIGEPPREEPGVWTVEELDQKGFTGNTLAELMLCQPDFNRDYILRAMAKADMPGAVAAMFPGLTDQARQTGALLKLRDKLERDAADEAYRLLKGEKPPEPPGLVSLTDFLQEPDEQVRYRVDGLWPSEGRIVLAAQNKSGKTTLIANLIRSLADGDTFLDTFDVERADRVVLLDNEMSPSQIRRWLRDQGIRKTDAVDLVSLRGRVSSFNILDPAIRAEWANLIGPADVLIFDCLRPALDALGLSEDKESGRFLEALDELIYAAGIPELVLVHHMGHSNERSRGDSRLEDWPDAKWKILKADADDPDSPRYFSAFGRDVDQPEVRLAFDPDTRHLRVDGGSRKQATSSRIENAVLIYIAENPGCGMNDIRDDVDGDSETKRKVVKTLISEGALRMVKVGQKHTHYLSGDSPDKNAEKK